MAKKIFLFTLALAFLASNFLLAQHNAPCLTNLSYALKDAASRAIFERAEIFNQQFIIRQSATSKTNDLPYPTASKYVIPVVVHVIHAGIEGAHAIDSISFEQVASMFDVLFQDFRKLPGTRAFGGGVDTQIEFCLATKDPAGKPTTGVLYYKSPEHLFLNMEKHDKTLKTEIAPAWDNTKYFNVWLVKRIVDKDDQAVAVGYAQFPFEQNRAVDGIVVVNSNWGLAEKGTSTQYTYTATHEAGHWLNLYHPFETEGGSACHPNTRCQTQGDLVCDTPPVNTGEYKLVDVRINTCSQDQPDLPDDQLLYMDYSVTEDGKDISNSFSSGQVARMQATLNNPAFPHRINLWKEENLRATGTGKYAPPTAYFWSDKQTTCVGSKVKLLDYSKGQPNKFEWLCPDAIPERSTDAVPEITYAKKGTYSVTLIIGNESGVQDTFIRENFITVIDTSFNLPFYEIFEKADGSIPPFPPIGWILNNPDAVVGGRTWTNVALGGAYGKSSRCARINLFSYPRYNQKDELVTAPINIGTATNLGLTFAYAYSPLYFENSNATKVLGKDNNGKDITGHTKAIRTIYADTLTVFITEDCGTNWTQIWKKGGTQLQTVERAMISTTTGAGGAFDIPRDSTGWKTAIINLDANLYRGKTVQFLFQTTNRFGNNLYLDDVSLKDTLIATSNTPVINLSRFIKVAPNPFENKIVLELDLQQSADFQFTLLDLTGRIVYYKAPDQLIAGKHQFEIDTPSLPVGVYIAYLQLNEQTYVHKVIKN